MKEETVEGVRNAEGGTCRRLESPGPSGLRQVVTAVGARNPRKVAGWLMATAAGAVRVIP